MSGARSSSFMIWVIRARVTRPRRASSSAARPGGEMNRTRQVEAIQAIVERIGYDGTARDGKLRAAGVQAAILTRSCATASNVSGPSESTLFQVFSSFSPVFQRFFKSFQRFFKSFQRFFKGNQVAIFGWLCGGKPRVMPVLQGFGPLEHVDGPHGQS